MSGMAILLLCTLQVDHPGWRMQPHASGVGPVTAVQPSGSPELWGQAAQVGSLATSVWPEIERALEQPAAIGSRSAHAPPKTLRKRIRGPENVATLPPEPPGTSRAAGGEATLPIDSLTNLQLGRPGAPSAVSATTAGGPSFPAHNGQTTNPFLLPGEESLRVSQSFPPSSESLRETQGHSLDQTFGERGVTHGGRPDASAIGRERYLSPPARAEGHMPQQLGANEQDASTASRAGAAGLLAGQQGSVLTLPAPPGTGPGTAVPDRSAEATTAARGTNRPWGPLLMAVLGLFGSLGFNLYLSWIAWDLYSRYHDAVDDVQELEAKLEAKQQEVTMSTGPRPVARRTTMVSG